MQMNTTTWRVNPLVGRSGMFDLTPAEREAVAIGAGMVAGECLFDVRREHCHGAEIVHLDGVAERVRFPGEHCTAPAGLHMHVHACDGDGAVRYRHECTRCG